jgi:DNA-binding GntR family transcriptional regulator
MASPRQKGARTSRSQRPIKRERGDDSNPGVPGMEGSGEPPTSQTDDALDTIRSRIIDLALAPGSRIDENLLLNEFRLGRTPAREAINRLAAEGFVNIVPNRGGTYVRKLDFQEIGEILIAHQLAENILGQLCRFNDSNLVLDLESIQEMYRTEVAKRRYLNITALNEQFHMRMNRTIRNSFYNDFAKSTHRHVRRLNVYMYRLEAAEPGEQDAQFELNLEQHDAIIEAVRAKDRALLIQLLPEHARATQDRLVRVLESKRAHPFPLALYPLQLPE